MEISMKKERSPVGFIALFYTTSSRWRVFGEAARELKIKGRKIFSSLRGKHRRFESPHKVFGFGKGLSTQFELSGVWLQSLQCCVTI